MLNKKDFLKYASKLAFPIMIQNLIGTLVNIADTVMLGYVSQTAMSASSLANHEKYKRNDQRDSFRQAENPFYCLFITFSPVLGT